MNDLLPFSFESYEVTAAVIDGDPLFSANDVAIAVGYSDYRQAVRNHCKHAAPSPTPLQDKRGQVQHPNLIPESDVYRLIFRSRLPAAERFMDWVAEDVLPALRHAGHYAVEGGKLDHELMTCSVGYATLVQPFRGQIEGLTQQEDRTLTGFSRAMQAAGLPAQFEGVAPDPEIYRVTPAAARVVIETLAVGRNALKAEAARRALDEALQPT